MTIINSISEVEASFDRLYYQLSETAFKNYKLGSIKPSAMTHRDGDKVNQLISYELFNIIDKRFSVKEKFLLNRINQARSQALNVARQGDIATAEQLMEKVRTTWDINQVSAEVNLLYKSFQAAAEAYLDYRRSDFAQAWSHITEAIITDAVLETEYGYQVLFAHRLHLVQNLVRSEARGGRIKEAVKLGSQLLAYLEGKSENLPFPVSWDVHLIANLPPEVISITFNLVTNEIALILAGKNLQEGQELWKIIAEYINLEFDDAIETYPPAYYWLRMKQALFNSNLANGIELISQFLAAGRSQVPLLWYTTVIDLVKICNQLHLPNAAIIKQEIANDVVHWEDFPKQFLSLLNN
ncbi:hypothetical protein H6G76_00245 [Nostoc sp. FACHB-152]|uniref:hypothetical protein n=1 Tax=unclassified Nostoc TaxID=2593658 RepID=UPI0016825E97|nr:MULTISPECIES: hypothetical protein [unclassified Nostoc]MBD2445601.1 hypothetical protein [Nostoc sp. FACHB-152]MBD2466714.1 hypothetical protein [Nostoc sp. FACHB-145]